MLKLVKFWDHTDGNLFLQNQYRYTVDGLTKYWMSVDASIRFWVMALAKKFEPGKKNINNNLETRQSSE